MPTTVTLITVSHVYFSYLQLERISSGHDQAAGWLTPYSHLGKKGGKS